MSAVENVADVLDAAADLLEPKGAWTQGAFARNADGDFTGLSEFRGPAVCWCIMGATEKVTDDPRLAGEADRYVARLVPGFSIEDFNDAPERTQAEVVAKLREAAALARQEQAA